MSEVVSTWVSVSCTSCSRKLHAGPWSWPRCERCKVNIFWRYTPDVLYCMGCADVLNVCLICGVTRDPLAKELQEAFG